VSLEEREVFPREGMLERPEGGTNCVSVSSVIHLE
jgi:hypothetical protein